MRRTTAATETEGPARIEDVADTALWIAAYRARETRRPAPLFRDPLAERLAGSRGATIAREMVNAPQFDWMTAVRTVVVDDLVTDAITRGARTVLNLGAGLDTRPYRLALPSDLRWIEVDVDKIVSHKAALLDDEAPGCTLERVVADLADDRARRALLDRIDAEGRRVVVLTEGVIGYLREEDVGRLADDLRQRASFGAWIVDRSATFLNFAVRLRTRRTHLAHAPLRFAPSDWEGFFRAHGWRIADIRHLPVEGERLGRPLPIPWWFRPVHRVLPRAARDAVQRMFSYARLEPTTR